MPTPPPPSKKVRIPKYCRHKGTGQAYVLLDGKETYLGRYDTPESRAEYERIIREWLQAGRRLPVPTATVAVVEVIAAFLEHAREHYRRADGTPTNEFDNFRDALRPLKRLYGHTEAARFGPLALKAVRGEMIGMGWSRLHINRQVNRIRHVFKWAASQEIVPASVHAALKTVNGLAEGRSAARETEPVQPVEEQHVAQVLPFLPPEVRAMVELQLLAGMRPDEVLRMKTGEIDRDSQPWVYTPAQHKTRHRGHKRTISLGPRAQQVLQPMLRLDPELFIFSPAQAMAAHRERRRAARKTPLSCGTVAGENMKTKPSKGPGGCYTVESYNHAIDRACDKAFPPPPHLERQHVPARGRKAKSMRWETEAEWKSRLGESGWAELVKWRHEHRFNPHQLRHTLGTRIRHRFGLEAAQVVLGHKNAKVSEIYAEADAEAASRIMGEVG